MGFYRNRKTAENNPKPQKIGSKPKTACKTVKTEEFSHSSSQKNPNLSNIVVTSGAYRSFAAIQSQWSRIIAAQNEEKSEPR